MKLQVTQYKWAGSWGPFKIRTICGECSITETIIKKVIAEEFPDFQIDFQIREWLPNWWRIILRGAWHAPIVFVNGKIIQQGKLLDPGILAAALRSEIALQSTVGTNETIIFGKESCQFCQRAKELMLEKGLDFKYYNVIQDPLSTATMFQLIKPLIPHNQPVTVPQIWMDGKYIGGYDDLEKYLGVDTHTDDDPKCADGVCQI